MIHDKDKLLCICNMWMVQFIFIHINIGLPAIVCKDLPDDVQTGDTMELHMSDGTAVANGKTYTCTKLPEYMQGILNQGGLIASLNKEEK